MSTKICRLVAFRILLAVVSTGIFCYTGIVGFNHGWNLLPVFFGDMVSMNWPGQFNFDFMFLLMFSGLWLAWRHRFSSRGIVIGILGLFGGTMFLAPYLLYASIKADGDIKKMLLGDR